MGVFAWVQVHRHHQTKWVDAIMVYIHGLCKSLVAIWCVLYEVGEGVAVFGSDFRAMLSSAAESSRMHF